MPKPGNSPEDASVEVDLPKEEDQDSKGVEIDLNETEQKGKKKEVSVDPEQLEKLHRRNEYLNRQLEKTTKQMETISAQLSQLQNQPRVQESPKAVVEEDLDEIDKAAQTDWKKAVRMIGEKQYAELRKQEEEARIQQQRVYLQTSQLEKSKQNVLSRYPGIEDTSTEEAKTYIEVLNENPDLLSNPRGPELAMYEMESRLRTKGVVPVPVRQEVNDEAGAEIQRRLRAHAGAPAHGRFVQDSNKIVLSPEEKAHCDQFGIPYVEYAKMYKLGPQGFREGVSV